MSSLLACLLHFFPLLYSFSIQLKEKLLFHFSPLEQHPSVSKYDTATKFNKVIDPIGSTTWLLGSNLPAQVLPAQLAHANM